MTTQAQNQTTYWVLYPDRKTIVKQTGDLSYDKIKELIGCEWVEWLNFGDYTVAMNEEPQTADKNNDCASKLFKLTRPWKGVCVIYKPRPDDDDEDEEGRYDDMDVSPQQLREVFQQDQLERRTRLARLVGQTNAQVITLGQ